MTDIQEEYESGMACIRDQYYEAIKVLDALFKFENIQNTATVQFPADWPNQDIDNGHWLDGYETGKEDERLFWDGTLGINGVPYE